MADGCSWKITKRPVCPERGGKTDVSACWQSQKTREEHKGGARSEPKIAIGLGLGFYFQKTESVEEKYLS